MSTDQGAHGESHFSMNTQLIFANFDIKAAFRPVHEFREISSKYKMLASANAEILVIHRQGAPLT